MMARLDGLGASGGSEFVEDAGTVSLDGVLGDEKLACNFAVAQAAGDQAEDFHLTCRDPESHSLDSA